LKAPESLQVAFESPASFERNGRLSLKASRALQALFQSFLSFERISRFLLKLLEDEAS
jgi:hypothetical protein